MNCRAGFDAAHSGRLCGRTPALGSTFQPAEAFAAARGRKSACKPGSATSPSRRLCGHSHQIVVSLRPWFVSSVPVLWRDRQETNTHPAWLPRTGYAARFSIVQFLLLFRVRLPYTLLVCLASLVPPQEIQELICASKSKGPSGIYFLDKSW